MTEMSKEDARAKLEAENIGHFNWFDDRYPREYEAGIQKVDSGWRVYYADEKAGQLYDQVHEDEGEALTKFLDIARANNRHWEEVSQRYDEQLRAAGHSPTTG